MLPRRRHARGCPSRGCPAPASNSTRHTQPQLSSCSSAVAPHRSRDGAGFSWPRSGLACIGSVGGPLQQVTAGASSCTVLASTCTHADVPVHSSVTPTGRARPASLPECVAYDMSVISALPYAFTRFRDVQGIPASTLRRVMQLTSNYNDQLATDMHMHGMYAHAAAGCRMRMGLQHSLHMAKLIWK